MQAKQNTRAAEGLWHLADSFEHEGAIPQAVKCLEAICQCDVLFQPWIEAKTRLRLASLLLEHCDNTKAAQSHLERALVVVKHVPGHLALKCSCISLLSHCYSLGCALHAQKQMLVRGLQLAQSFLPDEAALIWMCNFALQLAAAQLAEGEAHTALGSLGIGSQLGQRLKHPGIQFMFAVPTLHVHILAKSPAGSVRSAAASCEALQSLIPPQTREDYQGLLIYNHLLQAIWHLNTCDYPKANAALASLDKMVGNSAEHPAVPTSHHTQASQSTPPEASGNLPAELPEKLKTKSCRAGRLLLGPPPLDVEWLPLVAVYVLVDLLAVATWRAAGNQKEVMRRLRIGMGRVQGELPKLGVFSASTEADIQQSSMEDVGTLLHLWMHLLEQLTVFALTRTQYQDAQQSLAEMVDGMRRFPQLLAAHEGSLQVLLGHYAHSLGEFHYAVAHFTAAKTAVDLESKLLCDVYAALSHMGMATSEAFSQALDLLTPPYATVANGEGPDSERLRVGALFGMGLLRFQQGQYGDSRVRLASGLRTAHERLIGHHLLAQFLVPLGSVGRQLQDLLQAKEILRSAVTTARIAGSGPTQLLGQRELEEVQKLMGDSAGLLESQASSQRKALQLQEIRCSVASAPLHRHLLQYGV